MALLSHKDQPQDYVAGQLIVNEMEDLCLMHNSLRHHKSPPPTISTSLVLKEYTCSSTFELLHSLFVLLLALCISIFDRLQPPWQTLHHPPGLLPPKSLKVGKPSGTHSTTSGKTHLSPLPHVVSSSICLGFTSIFIPSNRNGIAPPNPSILLARRREALHRALHLDSPAPVQTNLKRVSHRTTHITLPSAVAQPHQMTLMPMPATPHSSKLKKMPVLALVEARELGAHRTLITTILPDKAAQTMASNCRPDPSKARRASVEC